MSYVQYAEQAVRRALVYTFPDVEPITLETIEGANQELRRATLGNLIRKLRERGVEIDESFDKFLSDFLDHRNMFAHNIHLDEQYDLETAEGLARFNAFVQTLGAEAVRVVTVFTAAALAFTKGDGRFMMRDVPDDQQDARQLALVSAVQPGRFFRKP